MSPQLLYKYRAIDNNTIRLLLLNEAYFASSRQFNDPYESRLNLDLRLNLSDVKEIFVHGADVMPVPEDILSHFVGNPDAWEPFERAYAGTLEKRLEEISMYSLSSRCDDIRMFSHYADGHKGLCLEFTYSSAPFFNPIFEVEYAAAFPPISYKELRLAPEEYMRKWLCTKSSIWAHEKEWRVIKFGERAALHNFPSEALSGVIFGCSTPEADIRLVKECLAKRPTKTSLYKARRNEKRYRLDIVPMEDVSA
jgi:hypothetical protein